MRLASIAVGILVAQAFVACGSEECPSARGLGLSVRECDQVLAIALPATLPPAPGNAHGDDLDAATLGHRIFFDARFSSTSNVRCATCHQSERAFQDGVPTPTGFAVTRNTPSTLHAGRLRWQFWDGRADSTWSQAISVFENAAEMDFGRLEIAHLVQTLYADRYSKVFGPMPDLSDPTRFPARGRPGSPAWEGMAPVDREVIDRIVANVAKSLEAYQRKATAGPSRVDRFLSGERGILTGPEAKGIAVGARSGCFDCHAGPMMTDEKFRNLGLGRDEGRSAAFAVLAASPFTARGPYWDGPRPNDPASTPGPQDVGAFRTPTLRDVGRTAPYGHDGSLPTLEDAVDFHFRADPGGVGVRDTALPLAPLSAADRAALLAFLRALDSANPPYPWADWPRG
jgi:cytochrome c peroxidase